MVLFSHACKFKNYEVQGGTCLHGQSIKEDKVVVRFLSDSVVLNIYCTIYCDCNFSNVLWSCWCRDQQ